MLKILRDAFGDFCSGCGSELQGEFGEHQCKPAEILSLADADVACQTLEDTILRAAEAWNKLTYSQGTRSSAHGRMEQWLADLKRRARVQEYHTNKRVEDGS